MGERMGNRWRNAEHCALADTLGAKRAVGLIVLHPQFSMIAGRSCMAVGKPRPKAAGCAGIERLDPAVRDCAPDSLVSSPGNRIRSVCSARPAIFARLSTRGSDGSI
jgi:hypothetical protein